MTRQRLFELLLMVAIGKGIIILLNPGWHLKLWRSEAPAYGKIIDELSSRPNFARLLGALTVVLGIVVASRQEAE